MTKSKVQQYIEDAVEKTAKEIKTKGVEIHNCQFNTDEHIHVDNGDLSEVLLQLAIAQQKIADAVVCVSKSKPSINNNSVGLKISGIGNDPMKFEKQ